MKNSDCLFVKFKLVNITIWIFLGQIRRIWSLSQAVYKKFLSLQSDFNRTKALNRLKSIIKKYSIDNVWHKSKVQLCFWWIGIRQFLRNFGVFRHLIDTHVLWVCILSIICTPHLPWAMIRISKMKQTNLNFSLKG